MEREKTDAEWLSSAKTNLEDLINWSDELPNEFISGKTGYSRHKFRGNWFQGVLSSIQLVTDICNDPQLIEDANRLTERRRAKDVNAKTTRDEINEADQLIRRTLEKLKNII